MAIEMPSVEGHPNRVAFRGVLTFVGVPSDKAPAGAQGHRVLLTQTATEKALPSLLGMALDYAPTLDRHDARRKAGIITRAEVLPGRPKMQMAARGPSTAVMRNTEPQRARLTERLRAGGNRLLGSAPPGSTVASGTPRIDVAGYIFGRDFPDLVKEMRRGGAAVLGMSYEITDARIEDLKASIWMINEFVFTGAAILRRDKAAYQNTWIELD